TRRFTATAPYCKIISRSCSSSATVISSRISCCSPLRITCIARLLAKKKPHQHWVRLHHHAHWMDRHQGPSAAFPTPVLSSSGSKGPKDAVALRKPLPQRLQALMVPPRGQAADALEGFKLQYTRCQKGVKTNFAELSRNGCPPKLCHHPPRQRTAILLS